MFEERKKQSFEEPYRYMHLDAAKIEEIARLRFASHYELFRHIRSQERIRVRL